MFSLATTTIKKGQSIKYELFKNDKQLSYGHFVKQLQKSEVFRSFFINILQEVLFDAYHWETPAVNQSKINDPFEFVVSRTPGIDLPPDYGPFQQYVESTNKAVAVFDNLGGDAKLIAPVPPGEERNYSHIGRFTQNASSEEQHALWKRVGQVMQEQISDQPLWLNTAGGGVAWLHVRLDSRPKYYMHKPYC